MTTINDGDAVEVDVPLERANLHVTFRFAEVRPRLGYGEGWMVAADVNGTRYDATGVTADDGKEQLIAKLQGSREVQERAAQEAVDADEAYDRSRFDEPEIPPE